MITHPKTDVFTIFQQRIKFDLAKAASLALYNINKNSQMFNNVSKLVHE